MTILLKLGGSLLTRKDRPETLDRTALSDAADDVAEALGRGSDDRVAERGVDRDRDAEWGSVPALSDGADLVIAHGGGSFGHHYADAYGVSVESGTRDAAAARAIHDAMTSLDDAVLSALHARGVPALPVRPLSAAARDAGGTLRIALDAVETQRAAGFVPVLHGDVVAHAGEGVTILSGDEIVARLAGELGADRVGFCSTVSGVLDADGDVIPEIRAFDDVAHLLGGSEATDVTGGMAGKVRELLALGAPAFVFGPDGLAPFLRGESPGTKIDGR